MLGLHPRGSRYVLAARALPLRLALRARSSGFTLAACAALSQNGLCPRGLCCGIAAWALPSWLVIPACSSSFALAVCATRSQQLNEFMYYKLMNSFILHCKNKRIHLFCAAENILNHCMYVFVSYEQYVLQDKRLTFCIQTEPHVYNRHYHSTTVSP